MLIDAVSDTMPAVGRRLIAEREQLGLTREQAAERIGIHTNTLWRVEHLVGSVRPSTAKRIADYYNAQARAVDRPGITVADLWPHGLRAPASQ